MLEQLAVRTLCMSLLQLLDKIVRGTTKSLWHEMLIPRHRGFPLLLTFDLSNFLFSQGVIFERLCGFS